MDRSIVKEYLKEIGVSTPRFEEIFLELQYFALSKVYDNVDYNDEMVNLHGKVPKCTLDFLSNMVSTLNIKGNYIFDCDSEIFKVDLQFVSEVLDIIRGWRYNK